MRTYAILKDLVVTEITTMDVDQCAMCSLDSMVVDVEDQIPQVQIGWVLEGNKIKSNIVVSDPDEMDAVQQTSQRIYGQRLLPIAVDLVGARNLKLSREGTPANVQALAVQMQTVKVLMESGALKTTRTVCESLKPGFPLHADILQYVIDDITAFLVMNNWN